MDRTETRRAAADAMTHQLRKLTRDARDRFVGAYTDPEEIVELLGGDFVQEDEYHVQGDTKVFVLRGKNRREAVVTQNLTTKEWTPVRVFEPRLRVVEGGER